MNADLRLAMRQLRKAPGFAITAVFTLAIGWAASSCPCWRWGLVAALIPARHVLAVDRMILRRESKARTRNSASHAHHVTPETIGAPVRSFSCHNS